MNIDVFTIIGPRSNVLAEFAQYTMEKLKSGKHSLRYFCLQNDDHTLPKGWTNLESYHYNGSFSSAKHATGLNKIIDYIRNDADFILIVDTDIAVLLKDWDDVCVDLLMKTRCGIVGADSGRYSVGGYFKRYANFPCVFFHMTPKDVYLHVKCDYTPVEKEDVLINDDFSCLINNVAIGSVITKDTGWQMPWQFKCAGFQGNCFFMTPLHQSMLKPIFDEKFARDVLVEEFWYGNEPIVNHLACGSTLIPVEEIHKWKECILLFLRHKYPNLF